MVGSSFCSVPARFDFDFGARHIRFSLVSRRDLYEETDGHFTLFGVRFLHFEYFVCPLKQYLASRHHHGSRSL